MRISIVGTAGRKRDGEKLDIDRWNFMVREAQDILAQIPGDIELVSGGAAWADHVAVHLFLQGQVKSLELHLPCKFFSWNNSSNKFYGSDIASLVNNLHGAFSDKIFGETNASLNQLALAMSLDNCTSKSYDGFLKRNTEVAKSDVLIAFTFGENEPSSGGTMNTWRKCKGQRIHVSLLRKRYEKLCP